MYDTELCKRIEQKIVISIFVFYLSTKHVFCVLNCLSELLWTRNVIKQLTVCIDQLSGSKKTVESSSRVPAWNATNVEFVRSCFLFPNKRIKPFTPVNKHENFTF